MSAFRTDGTFSSASACGAARKSFPFDGDNTSFIVEQDFMIAFASFSPLALSTAHPTFTSAYLVKESPLEDLGGGIAKWTRTYAQIPATRNEWATHTYTFPGFYGSRVPPYSQYFDITGDERDPFTTVATSRLYHEYFLCASGQTYTTPANIPVVTRQLFTLDGRPTQPTDYLVDHTANPALTETDPSLPDYLDMIDNGDEIVAEDSTLQRWMGDIYVRITRYIVAQ